MKKRERLNKKALAMALVLVMIVGLIPGNVFAASHNTMETGTIAFTVGEAGYWTGDTWMESDATSYIQADRIMVPVAHASRALGADVTWKAETKEVEVTHHDDTYTLTIGSTQLQKNGELLEEMDTIPVIQNIGNGLGRTMLPVSRLAKVLNVAYTWDAETKTATFMPLAEGPVVFDEAGTYGPEEDIETIDNDVIISADGVTLQNMIITGSLTITEDVGDGDVTLNNITVEGDTLIQGGGTDSIYINGGSYNNIIVQRTPTGAVRVVVSGQNNLNIEVDEEAEEQILILEGFYDKVIVNAPNVRIITRGETHINELIITGSASNTTLETSDDTTIDKALVDGEGAVFEGASDTVKEVEGDEKDSLVDKDNVIVTTTRRSGGSSSSDDDDEEVVEESSITDAEVDITSGSIVFDYIFYEEAEEVTYLEATQDPYYLDTSNSYVELINGEDSVIKDFDQLNPTDDGQVVYADLDDIIASWWSGPEDAFVPEQIRIYLTPTEEGEWEAFEVVRDLTEGEKSLFMPPSEFAGGNGTEANPYQVATAQQLDNVRNYMDKHFIQVEHIDLTDMEWVPIGEFSSGSQFIGSYDGNNKTIDNLNIVPDASDQYIGLFGVIGYDWEAEISAELSNINLINVTISGTELHSVGSLAGRANNNTTIDNCSASGEITALDQWGYAIGGLVGDNSATLTNSQTNVTIYVSPTGIGTKAGGLAGHNGGHIDNCFATGDVTGNEYVGGLLGWHTNNPLTNSYSTGNVTGDESVGGLIGLAWSITEKSFSSGNVSGNSAVGGLIGNLPGYARNVYAAGSVSGGGSVGGLVGFYSGGGGPAEITNAYAFGQVSGSSNTGGLVGAIWGSSPPAPITASYWDTETTEKLNSVGGTGYVTSAMIMKTNSVLIYEDWDFDNTWTIKAGESYPYFIWQRNENIPYPPKYDITIDPVIGGNATVTSVPLDQAIKGTTITVEIEDIETGKQFDSITVTASDSSPITTIEVAQGVEYTFTMPSMAVNVAVELSIDDSNDATVANDDSAEVDEDSTVLIDVLVNDDDLDGDTLSITGFTQGSNGTVSQEGDSLRYTPEADYNGVDSFTYDIANTKGNTSTATVTVTINPVNDLPVAANDTATIEKNSTLLIDVLANDTDVDEDTLSITGFTQGANGTVVQEGNSLRYSPNLDYTGKDSFMYEISDGNGGIDTATVEIIVSTEILSVDITDHSGPYVFPFTIISAGIYVFETSQHIEPCDTVMYLYDINENLIAENDDYGGFYSTIVENLASGDYVLKVEEKNSEQLNLILKISSY